MPIRLDNPHCPEAVARGAQGSLDFLRPEWLAKFARSSSRSSA
jgi:hypothetical protein